MKKGFTLIELLAVIIILAVVALIATPIVLDVVNDARESTAKSQAYYILDGARNYYAESIFDNNKKNKIDNNQNIYNDIEMSQKIPSEGQLYVNKNGLTALAVVINKKCYQKEFGGELQIIDSIECDLNFVGDDEVAPIVEFTVVGEPLNENGWSKEDFYINIEVIDNESGAFSYKWCSGITDCEPISLVEASSGSAIITMESDNNIVCVIGYDKVGNQSDKTCSEPYKLDKTAPMFSGISDIFIQKNDAVDLTSGVLADDILSGIDGTYSYEPSTVDTSNSGTINIVYSVSDKAGNTNTVTRKVIVDTDAPTVTYKALGETINASGWSKEDFFVEVTLIDNSNLGIKEAKWCSTINDTCIPSSIMVGDIMTPLISIESNNNRICVQATDNNNKTSEVICSDSYRLDKTSPSIAFSQNGNNEYVKMGTSNVTLTDNNSGLLESSFKYLWSASTNTPSEGSFNNEFTNGAVIITSEGLTGDYYLWILGKDNAGNKAITRSNAFKLDNIKPDVSNILLSASNVTETSFTINQSGDVSDAGGLSSTPYTYQISTNQSTWVTKCINNSTSCNASGLTAGVTYYYRMCASDVAGNQSCTNSNTIILGSNYYCGPLTGTATASDVLSGKTFYNSIGFQTGIMPNNGSQSATLNITGSEKPSKNIPLGYTSGGTVTAQLDPSLASSIKSGVTIGGVSGNLLASPPISSGSTIIYESESYRSTTSSTFVKMFEYTVQNFTGSMKFSVHFNVQALGAMYYEIRRDSTVLKSGNQSANTSQGDVGWSVDLTISELSPGTTISIYGRTSSGNTGSVRSRRLSISPNIFGTVSYE